MEDFYSSFTEIEHFGKIVNKLNKSQRPNPGQEDVDNNLVGDICDTPNDRDKDGVPDEVGDQKHQPGDDHQEWPGGQLS